MSRSYKKFPVVRQEKPNANDKRIAQRKARRKAKECSAKGSDYRKIAGIEIGRYAWTKEDATKLYYSESFREKRETRYPTLESYLEFWEKCTLRK